MTRTRWLLGVSVLSIAVGLAAVARAVGRPTGASFWSGPYTPTRIEWLALQLNVEAGKRCDYQRDPDCIAVDFSPLVDSTGLALAVLKGSSDEKIARDEIIRAVERVRMHLLSNAWVGNVPSIMIMQTESNGLSAWRCIPRQVTGPASILRPERYKTAQLADVCDSLTRAQ